jgi:hypothetical protein
MPRIALAMIALFASACSFDAGYEGARCSGSCPSGLICHLERCVTAIPIDMAVDIPPDEMTIPAALTCADPGVVVAPMGTVMGTTAGTTSKMASSCGGFVNNGPDRVYRITMNGSQMLRVSILDGARKAYVLASCVETPPGTPACLGNTRASMGSPIVVQPAAGPAFVVVDDETAGASGTYTLHLEVL